MSNKHTKTLIKNYELLSLLGEGNFGYVFRGKCQTTGRDVAIKIEKELDIPTSLIKHEAQVLLSLKGCPGVPALFDYGLYKDHRYIITQLFDETLETRMRTKSLSSSSTQTSHTSLELLVIKNKLTKIVKEIHKRGFIHRDIKPDNIMFDNNNNIYLIDFGFATNYNMYTTSSTCQTETETEIKTTTSGKYVGTYDFLGECGRKGLVCKEVDYEGLDITMNYIKGL